MVKTGFNRYLIDGFKSGIPPTVAILIKKNTILINIKQNPIEYMSLLLKYAILSKFSFKKYFGIIVEPIKNATNAITNVIARLWDNLFNDNNRNAANKNRTINGLKI